MTPLLEAGRRSPDMAESVSNVGVLLALTMLSVVVGEMVPKTIALRFPTEVALMTTLPMLWSGRLYAWFIVILDRSAAALRALLRMPTATHRHVHSPEEIDLLIARAATAACSNRRNRCACIARCALASRCASPDGAARGLAAIDINTSVRDVLRIAVTSPTAACRSSARRWTT